MAFVGGQLAPAVAVQQVVDRGQRHGTAQGSFDFTLDLTDHQDAARASAIKKGRQHLALLLSRHVLVAPAAARGALAVTCNLAGQEAIAQAAGPRRGAADDLRGLLQAQAIVQRQHHRLCLAKLLSGLCAGQHLTGRLQTVGTSGCSCHVVLLAGSVTWIVLIY